MQSSRSQNAVIRVYDESDNVIERHEYRGDFKEWQVRNLHRNHKML